MPRRILADDFGEDLWECNLSDQALTSYTFITRAACYYGGTKNNPAMIHVKAFKGRATPCVDDVKRMLKEYEQAGILERWKDKDGREWLWFKRWFRDNSFKMRTKPSIPRPPSLARLITQNDWDNGNSSAIAKLQSVCRKHSASGAPEVEVEVEEEVKGEVEEEEINDVFSHFCETIKKGKDYTPKPQVLKRIRAKIKQRLKERTIKEIKESLTRLMSNNWYVKNCGWREAEWFFSSDKKIEKHLHIQPEKRTEKTAPEDVVAKEI
jgi:hypothetical protein